MVPLGPLPGACWTPLISLLLVYCLLPPGSQGQKFLLEVEPKDLVVPAGGSLLVNCSTQCPNPELISLETFLPKKPVGNGPGWAAFWLSNVTVDSKVLCSGFCNGSQMASSSNITVYRFPKHVELASMSPWKPVGKNLTLRCLVTGGAPRTHLSVLLLRGEEVLSRQLAVGEPAEVTATVLVSRNDHGANFSCRTELDLRPQGLGLFQNNSAPSHLRTFVLPVMPPRLIVPRFLEVGTSWLVDCTLDGLFPASEAQVQLALGDQVLNPEVSSQGDTLKATATVTANTELEGTRKIVCNVTLGGESQETQENLTIYSFWGPIMNLSETIRNLSEPTVLEGTTVNVTCAAGARVQVMLDGAPAVTPGQLALLQLNVTQKDDKRSIFCNATLEVDGMVLHRNRSVQLRVLYGPKIDPAKCPQHFTWKDRTTQVLQCQASGNPVPQLQCLHKVSKVPVPVGVPFRVTLKHNGTYYCWAVNSQGTYNITVVINVQARNRNPLTITIIMAVFVTLGFLIVTAALVYVFRGRSDIYRVNRGNNFLPLKSKQPDEALGQQPS
ncbi:intercellular adhesion molecule 3 [Phyllostomus discolor]|uniref:Intercellular adhesion molecule 3 n=1 Tax=Phyllostomus discolor TaxID=89673 RepID=A0A6J2M6G3_9CHIR|nr:intercellular adhesion molecule 3 isoform X1 [Phyllostomus discolor]KAF6094256.1 intercellular adhesion molecule 3 [Phyllostomus discolor]